MLGVRSLRVTSIVVSAKLLARRRMEVVLLLLPIFWLGKAIPITGVAERLNSFSWEPSRARTTVIARTREAWRGSAFA